MATKAVKDLSEREIADLACSYAALILHDQGVDITGANLSKVISAAGVNVKGFWANLYAKALQGRDINSMFRVSGGSAAAAPAPAAAEAKKDDKAAKKDDKKDDKKKPEKKEQPPAEQGADFGMGDLFG